VEAALDEVLDPLAPEIKKTKRAPQLVTRVITVNRQHPVTSRLFQMTAEFD
jgi:hypothetical protein